MGGATAGRPRGFSVAWRRHKEALVLIAPGALVLVLAFLFPVGHILVLGFLGEEGVSLEHYAAFFVDDYYLGVVGRTFRLAFVITACCLLVGFPLAYLAARVGPRARILLILLVILPLMTSVVIRTFGWLVVLGPGGVLSDFLQAIGLTGAPTGLLHTETGIVIAMVQVLLPFMVLTVLGVLQRQSADLEEAARTMGASFWRVLRTVTLPLSVPGIVSGSLIVFALSISSFITPTLVGGVRLPVLAGSIYQAATGSFDWNFAGVQSTLLLLTALAVIIPYASLMRRRTSWQTGAAPGAGHE